MPSTTARALKRTLLRVCAAVGLFRLTGMLFSHRLQILCYHGFQLVDECRFRPQLFISENTFIGRLQYLVREGFVVLPLGEALTRMWNGTLPRRSLAITIDDGFKSTLSLAAPILLRFDLPATVYVTTYYMEKNVPVFRLAMQYLFWRASAGLPAAAASQQLMWDLIQKGEGLSSESERQSLLHETGRILADTICLDELPSLSIMSGEEVGLLARQGFDIQLHTHRHRFPSHDRSIACQEIVQNQSRLEAITGRKTRHFCYPSGIFASSQWAWLQELGIESAATCLPGLNTPRTPRYALRRFLDSEDISFVEFRAELAGFSELLRRVRAWVTFEHRPASEQTRPGSQN